MFETRARLAARNLAAPGEEIPNFLFLLDGRVIGHLSTIPFRLAAGGSEWPAHWLTEPSALHRQALERLATFLVAGNSNS